MYQLGTVLTYSGTLRSTFVEADKSASDGPDFGRADTELLGEAKAWSGFACLLREVSNQQVRFLLGKLRLTLRLFLSAC